MKHLGHGKHTKMFVGHTLTSSLVYLPHFLDSPVSVFQRSSNTDISQILKAP